MEKLKRNKICFRRLSMRCMRQIPIKGNELILPCWPLIECERNLCLKERREKKERLNGCKITMGWRWELDRKPLAKGHTRLNILDQSLLNPVRTKQALEKHLSNVGVPNGTKLRMLLLKEEVAQKMSMMTQYRKDRAYNSKAPSLRTICD